MKKPDDETLMAYVDAELSEKECRAVELFLADNPQAVSKVEEFRKTRVAINQFAKIVDQPVPDHLIETIRQHEHPPQVVRTPEPPRQQVSWFLLAASLVIGVALGSLGIKHILSQSHENEVAILAKALDVMTAENIALAEKAMAAKTKVLPFPLSLVSQAMENGSKVSPDMRETILSKLNAAPAPVSTADDITKLSTNAANVESLESLQPTGTFIKDKASVNANAVIPSGINNIIGEFSYAGQSCRLFKYMPRPSSPAVVLVACKKAAGMWKIVQKNLQ